MLPDGTPSAWSVRRYRPEDAQQLQRLYERVTQPYRPEDAAEVSAMHERARIARRMHDRWSPTPADERLRVDPEWRRRGIASALTRELMTFSAQAEHAFRALVLNTTSAQLPALALYSKVGFGEVGRCFLGAYELVWMHRNV